MTVPQAALELGVSKRRVRAMIYAGQIEAEQIYPGGSWVIQGPLKIKKAGNRWSVQPVKREEPVAV